jgi:peptidoglycan/LPS O-acetylase OafA/YrhL
MKETPSTQLDATRPEPLSYVSGLDGLRAVAVLAVILFHQHLFHLGWCGVQVFFVLSGFLISRSLLEIRGLPFSRYLGIFYFRRSLRIFPVYFLTLAVLAVLAIVGGVPHGVLKHLPYAATYTINFYDASAGYEQFAETGHLWSLAVEEQFYCLWPFLLYFCHRRFQSKVFLGLVLLGPAIRFVLRALLLRFSAHVFRDHYGALYFLTPTHVDAFALGALLVLRPWGGRPKLLSSVFAAIGLLGVAILLWAPKNVPFSFPTGGLTSLGYPIGLPWAYAYVWGYTLFNLCSALIIDCLISRKFLPRFFEWRPLAYLGRISYGVYLFHYPIQGLVERTLGLVRWPGLACELVLTIALASASFHFFESQFLRLKKLVVAYPAKS